MARKNRRVNRRKKQVEEVPTSSIHEFSRSTADLVSKLCKMANDNECVASTIETFKNQIGEVLDEHQRDVIESLMYETHMELQSLRGSEKSSSNSYPEDDSTTPEAPEPVPKKEEIEAPQTEEQIVAMDFTKEEVSLLGLGVSSRDAPSKFKIDNCLQNYAGYYLSKKDIQEKTGVNYDSVRKRITELRRKAPHSTTPTQILEDPYKEVSFKLGNTGTGITLYLKSKLAVDKRTELVSLATNTSS